MIEILIAILLGVTAGTFTGLIPGLHINLINTTIVAAALPFPPLLLCTFIIAMSITHTITDAIPSIYLGAPDSDHIMSVLPGHRMLLEGNGHQAVLCTIMGSIGTLLCGVVLFPLSIILLIALAKILTPLTPYLLIAVISWLIIAQKKEKWIASLALFLLAGAFGCIIFGLPNINQPLFGMLSGLFGASILITSIASTSQCPQQTHTTQPIPNTTAIRCISLATILGFFAAFLPGLGASQASVIAVQIMRNATAQAFLIVTGGINTASMIISLGTAYAINKARNGSIVAILEITSLDSTIIIPLVIGALIAGCIAVPVACAISKTASTTIQLLPYRTTIGIVLTSILIVAFVFDGIIGILILLTATTIGLLASSLGIPKHFLTGCLIIPVILYLI